MRWKDEKLWLVGFVAVVLLVVCAVPAAAFPPAGIGTAKGHVPDNEHTAKGRDVLDNLDGGNLGVDLADEIRNEHAEGAGEGAMVVTLGLDDVPDNGHTTKALEVLALIEADIMGFDLACQIRSEHAGDAGPGALGTEEAGGAACYSVTQNPEPATIGLMVLGIGGLLLNRKKH